MLNYCLDVLVIICCLAAVSSFRIEDLWGENWGGNWEENDNSNNDEAPKDISDVISGEEESSTASRPPIITQPSTLRPTQSATTTKPPNICTGKNGYVPHETNCSLFYSCQNNNPVDGSCPQYMWFDPNHNGVALCNFPEVVCASDSTVCKCAVEYPPLPPDPLVEPWVTCLRDNRFHFMASKVDCGRYFVCYNERVSRLECKDGLQFNDETQQCDDSHKVKCKVNVGEF